MNYDKTEILKIGIRIRTKNDRNGNPRRGWYVYNVYPDTKGSNLYGFLDEDYNGRSKFSRIFPMGIEILEIDVSPGEYESAMEYEVAN